MAEDDDTGDLLIGLSAIARHIGVSVEGVRYLWREGRIPVTKFGQFWIANKSALTKAMENESIRTRPGRKTDEERAAIQAVRTEAEQKISKSAWAGKLSEEQKQNLKSEAKPKLATKPAIKAKAKPKAE